MIDFVGKTIATTQGVIKKNPMLPQILGAPLVSLHKIKDKQVVALVAGWGRKNSFTQAQHFAKQNNKALITLEDGFLHGIGHKYYALSVVADDLGIYFDTRSPNRLEHFILDNSWDNKKQAIANQLIKTLIQNQLSKYNPTNSVPNLQTIANNNKENILIIDQVQGDHSLAGAGITHAKDTFTKMIITAKQLYPHANIFLKAHPAGKGFFNQKLAQQHQVFLLDSLVNPIALLEQASVVFTVSSHMGFEALMLNKKVICFGVSWYSGFGLTDDRFAPQSLQHTVKQRRLAINHQLQKSIQQLFYSAYIDYSYYGDPASIGINKAKCDIYTAIDWLIRNKTHCNTFKSTGLIYRLSYWKMPFVRQFLQTPKNHLTIKTKSPYHFLINKPPCPKLWDNYDFVVAWGNNAQTLRSLKPLSTNNPSIYCMEDGFLRSNGLGAKLIAPLSIALDSQGIYYNAQYPSDLETILSHIHLDTQDNRLIEQAQLLHHRILHKRISKYNIGKSIQLDLPAHTDIHLVVGQVEDDASVQNCLSPIRTNAELLRHTRLAHPQAFIIYKPHPDVENGLRAGAVDADTLALADKVAHDIAMPDCLDCCRTLHTISSLSGFEALLRQKQVVCHGLPFYAGFGLTVDIKNHSVAYQNALKRRQRATPLTLLELIYGALIAYPLYRLPNGIGLASAIQVVDFLSDHQHAPQTNTLTTQWMRLYAKLSAITK